MAGRLPHRSLRGLLSVHSRYGLAARGAAKAAFPSKAPTDSLPPPPLRLLPAGAKVAGQELHLLKIGAFPRRTYELDPKRVPKAQEGALEEVPKRGHGGRAPNDVAANLPGPG